MINIPIEQTWPSNIPLPYCDYSGGPRNSSIASQEDNLNIERRSRFETSYTQLSVTWVLSMLHYERFQEFYNTTLCNGAAKFSMPLKFPKNSELSTWIVQFMGMYRVECLTNRWRISADLNLLVPIELEEEQLRTDWGPLLMEPEESGQDFAHYITPDDRIIYVQS